MDKIISNNINQLWSEILNEIKTKLAKQSYEIWLEQIKPVSMENKQLLIEVPNSFTMEIMDGKYRDMIRDTIKKIRNEDYTIKFIYHPTIDIENFDNLSDDEKQLIKNKNNNQFSLDIPDNIIINSQKNRNNTAIPYSQNNMARPDKSGLNSKYTFETFVIGSSNRLAHAASLAVADEPARAYNPLFIYGRTGLGKTHLLHAIGHLSGNKYINTKILYVNFEKFTNEFINSIRDNKTLEFRNKYRNIDILLIDDIQFVTGKEQTQEEFFHTFNSLHENNKQIVISSDRPPREIKTLEDRLRSRFEWGLITDIVPPEIETRIAILKKMAAYRKISVPEEVMIYIATHIDNNIRELEGAFTVVAAHASLNRSHINMEVARDALKNTINSKQKNITIPLIIRITALHFGISEDDIKAKKRSREIAFPRQIAMFLSRELTDNSLPGIGKEFGGKDHSTVVHACNKIKESCRDNENVRDTVEKLIIAINS